MWLFSSRQIPSKLVKKCTNKINSYCIEICIFTALRLKPKETINKLKLFTNLKNLGLRQPLMSSRGRISCKN